MTPPPAKSNVSKGEGLLAGALLAVIIVRTWIMPMFSSLWIDEWVVYTHGRDLSQIDTVARQYIVDQRWIGYGGWLGMQVAGVNEIGVRLYSVVFGMYCLFAIFRLGRRWFDTRTALYAMLLFPCLQVVYQQVPNARAYTPAMAFFLSLLWCIELWLERRQWHWLLLGALCGYMLSAIHLIQAVGLGLAGLRVLWTVRPWKQWILPFAIFLPGLAEALRQIINRPLLNLAYLPKPAPTDFLEALFPQPATGLVFVALIVILGLRLGRWSASSGQDGERSQPLFSYLFLAFLLPPLLLFVLSTKSAVSTFSPRYYFTAFPAVALLLGWVLSRVEPFRWRATASVFVVASAAIILAGTQLIPSPNHENWRQALVKLRQMREREAEPILYYSGFLEADLPEWRRYYQPGGMMSGGLEFYRFAGNIIGLPYSDNPDRIAELKPELDGVFASNKRVWLLSRSPHGPMMDWLDRYIAAKGWKAHDMGFFESVRLNLLEPGPASETVNK